MPPRVIAGFGAYAFCLSSRSRINYEDGAARKWRSTRYGHSAAARCSAGDISTMCVLRFFFFFFFLAFASPPALRPPADPPTQWLYAPAATGLCPACSAPCVLPPSRGTSASPSSSPARARAHARPRTPPSSRSTSPHRNSSLDTSCPPSALDLDDGVLLPSLSSTKSAQFCLKPEESSTTIAAQPDSTKPQMKYPRPGADALVRLLAGFVAFILLLGALSRRGDESGVELGGEL